MLQARRAPRTCDVTAAMRFERALIDMLGAGKLHPRIYARLPLREAARAREMLENGEVIGKLLLIP